MGFALLGVMSMQFYFLRQSYQTQSDLFDRSVNDALSNVVSKLAKQDAINFLNKKAQVFDRQQARKDSPSHRSFVKSVETKYTKVYFDQKKPAKKILTAREKRLNVLRDSLKKVILSNQLDEEFYTMAESGELNLHFRYEEYTDEFGNVHQRMTDPKIVRVPVGPSYKRKPLKLHKYDTLLVDYIDPQFGKQVIPVVQMNPFWQREQERKRSERRFQEVKKMLEDDSIQKLQKISQPTNVIANLADEYQKSNEPLAKRLNPFWVDSLLRFELHNKGIFLPFTYSVSTFNSDSLLYTNVSYTDGSNANIIPANTYQVPIFTKEVINDPGRIKISFPQKNSLILEKMAATMATSGALLAAIFSRKKTH